MCLVCVLFITSAAVARGEAVLEFSGREWVVKSSEERKVGPGPNYFGQKNAWVDGQGRLHLKIAQAEDQDGKPRFECAEVVSKESFGFGTYRWYIESPVKADPRVVLGMFTWDVDGESARFHHRELDVELISTWGEPESTLNAQYCVQPWDRSGHRHRFKIDATNSTGTTHSFTWREDEVSFRSLQGHRREAGRKEDLLEEWTFSKQGVPPAGGENVRMNLWLLSNPPSPGNEWEITITKFEYEPLSPASHEAPSVEITETPSATFLPGPEGLRRIAGTVRAYPSGSKIVVYALGDRWYVQPLGVAPDTTISENGSWATRTHGGTKYAALLVEDSYKAPATLDVQPKRGGEVLAVTVSEPSR
jgi:hypothetical protein